MRLKVLSLFCCELCEFFDLAVLFLPYNDKCLRVNLVLLD